MSYTLAILRLSDDAYNEILLKLRAAGYDHTLIVGPYGKITINMDGIGVEQEVCECRACDELKKPIDPPQIGFQG